MIEKEGKSSVAAVVVYWLFGVLSILSDNLNSVRVYRAC